jgi:Tfp pilus assembly protein PilN
MANVNLISTRRSERVRLTKISKGLVVGTIGAGVVSLLGILVVGGQVMSARGQVAEVDRELSKLRPIIQEMEADQKERGVLQPKLATLTDAQLQTRRWFGMMEGFKRAVPEQTWLTNVSVEKSGENTKVLKINGVTVNQSRVGETMYRLSLQPDYYSKVDLRYTQTLKSSLLDNVEFELAAQLNLPEPDKKGEAGATKAN